MLGENSRWNPHSWFARMRNATEFLQTEQLGQMATKLKDFDVVKMHNKNQQLNLEQSVFCNVYRAALGFQEWRSRFSSV